MNDILPTKNNFKDIYPAFYPFKIVLYYIYIETKEKQRDPHINTSRSYLWCLASGKKLSRISGYFSTSAHLACVAWSYIQEVPV
jgi:hypothetical protein